MTATYNPRSKEIDWEAIQRDYRTGAYSFTELKAKHGASRGAICKRAKKYNWVKDFSQEVRARTEALLLADRKQDEKQPRKRARKQDEAGKQEISEAPEAPEAPAPKLPPPPQIGAIVPTEEDLDRAAAANAETIREHIRVTNKGIASAEIMLDRLHAFLKNEEVDGPWMGLKESPSDVMVKASQSLSRFIPLVRQAKNIDKDSQGDEAAAIAAIKRIRALADAERAASDGDG